MALLIKGATPPPTGVPRYSVIGDDCKEIPTTFYKDPAGAWVPWAEVEVLLSKIKELTT
jgi:hypothetical protein